MLELVFLVALWSNTNNEFIEVSNDQKANGYDWEYVGKHEASGTPAITIQPGNGKEIIFFRLEE
jgi:hypothetical protein|tara:strand:- start:2337 stop:2528 length:192 start_codon:yes stop_codon:yes gene_type:complete